MKFPDSIPRTRTYEGSVRTLPRAIRADGFEEFAREFSGAEFADGLYRVHTQESGSIMDWVLRNTMPGAAGMAIAIGADWLGRQYCIAGDVKTSKIALSIFDPATMESFNVPMGIEEFHSTEIDRVRESILKESDFKKFASLQEDWQGFGLKRCAGMRVPMQLGGTEDVENLEETDVEVYWELQSQLVAKTAQLPAGAKVKSVGLTNRSAVEDKRRRGSRWFGRG